jgi:16S rRNA processing protein RimM
VAPEQRVELGLVVGAHGLRGEIRVRVFGDGPENLALQPDIWLGEDLDDPNACCFALLGSGSGRTGEIRLRLEGIESREAALALRGQRVLATADRLERLEEGEFYWHELIGCRVETTSGERVGDVAEIWDTGRHDVLVVRGEDSRQILVPTSREIMTEVDRDARRIVIDAIPGLIDADD